MDMTLRKIVFVFLLLLYGVTIYAQDTLSSGKIITNVQLVGIGTVNQLDTISVPSEYTGTEIAIFAYTTRNGRRFARNHSSSTPIIHT